jgi:hypothetical protein
MKRATAPTPKLTEPVLQEIRISNELQASLLKIEKSLESLDEQLIKIMKELGPSLQTLKLLMSRMHVHSGANILKLLRTGFYQKEFQQYKMKHELANVSRAAIRGNREGGNSALDDLRYLSKEASRLLEEKGFSKSHRPPTLDAG